MSARHLNLVFVLLLAGTALTWWLGDSGWAERAGTWAVLAMFGVSVVKGTMVVLDFMALRGAPALWRRLMLGWLLGVSGAIVLIHALAAR